jgi:hypothetical protein
MHPSINWIVGESLTKASRKLLKYKEFLEIYASKEWTLVCT